ASAASRPWNWRTTRNNPCGARTGSGPADRPPRDRAIPRRIRSWSADGARRLARAPDRRWHRQRTGAPVRRRGCRAWGVAGNVGERPAEARGTETALALLPAGRPAGYTHRSGTPAAQRGPDDNRRVRK